jgi:uncharacterized membrane protein
MNNISAELIVFFSAMLPFIEIKASIPLGLKLGLSTLNSYMFSVAGMIVPGVIYLLILGPLTKYVQKKSKFLDKYLTKLFEKTRTEHKSRFRKLGPLLLIMIVGIPLPGSGTMTGALVAFVFGMEYWTAITFISIGAMISGALVLGGVSSIITLINFLS